MSRIIFLLLRLVGVSAMLATPVVSAQIRPSPLPLGTSSLGNQDDEQSLMSPNQHPQQPDRSTPLNANQAGRNARSPAGEVGQRETRESAATQIGLIPMARVASRIQNRVQNRLRTRIDRAYDPQSNANDPFLVAQDQIKAINRPR